MTQHTWKKIIQLKCLSKKTAGSTKERIATLHPITTSETIIDSQVTMGDTGLMPDLKKSFFKQVKIATSLLLLEFRL